MEKIKSLADLKKIRDNVQSKIDLREKSEHPENLIQIKVAMATCGIAAGSKETMNYFLNNLEKNGIQAVVTQTGCMGYCFATHGRNHQTGKRTDRIRSCQLC